MNAWGGLFEATIALLVLGWGFMELRGLRRDKKRAEEKARAAETNKKKPFDLRT